MKDEIMEFFKEIKESSLDPINKEINRNVFNNDDKLKQSVKNEITSIFYEWIDKVAKNVNINKEDITHMVMIGSITGFQYTDTSDIDVNVVIPALTDAKMKILSKILPNGNKIKGHPINYYLTTSLDNVNNAESSYDILKDEWLKKPEKDDVEIPYSYALEIARFFMDGLDNRFNEYERDKKELDIYEKMLKDNSIEVDEEDLKRRVALKEEEVRADLDGIKVGYDMLHSFRKDAFEKEYEPDFIIDISATHPNKSINNLVYKIMERFGYLDRVSKYKELRKTFQSNK